MIIVIVLVSLLVVVLAMAALRWIYRPPNIEGRSTPAPAVLVAGGELAEMLEAIPGAVGNQSGIHVMEDAFDAFAIRRDLIRKAHARIDVQYYMWHADLTGSFLAKELLIAADRGVRVRLLLDDNTTAGTDAMMQALASHANVEVRLFNPFILRKPRWPSYIFDLHRINRRMHNKSLTVDGCATVVGGRNIGDEYFGTHDKVQFADLDVLAVGPVVTEVLASFDEYWNSPSAFPLESLLGPPPPEARTAFEAIPHHNDQSDRLSHLERPSAENPLLQPATSRGFEWQVVKLIVDEAAKGQGDIPRRRLLIHSLQKRFGEVTRSLDIVTAYFVPGRNGANYLANIAANGVAVRVLTNSLASNDVVPVHAGYARYRKRLLRRGVALLEMRASVEQKTGNRRRKRKLPRFGASASSLHAKVFVLDATRVFIGSFNFDPRSVYLNCEMGLLIDSPSLGKRLSAQMDRLASNSYQPFLDPRGFLWWRDGNKKLHRMEPESTVQQRAVAWVISWLPVEWLL